MKKEKKDKRIQDPIEQLQLFGYENYFNSFVKLHENGNLPNCILFTGSKGIGKATFAFHIANYLLSINEKNNYSVKNLFIDVDNSSYKLIKENIHPNFYLIQNEITEKEIKIEKIRNLIRFINKSTYSKDLKIIIIDNAEYLNLNSSNALLKSIEEPSKNTFFIIIYNNSINILETIKSRCTEFKLFFSNIEKKNICQDLFDQYKINVKADIVVDNFYFDSPGNLLKYIHYSDISLKDDTSDILSCILFFIESYKNKKNPETLTWISTLVEKFYNNLCLNNNKNISNYFLNSYKILKLINDMKRFNLDENKNLYLVTDIILNETR